MAGTHRMAVLISAIFLISAFAGCTSDEEKSESSAIDLVVYYDKTSGIIEETMQNNQTISLQGVELSFDFAYTKSSQGDIESFYLLPGDGGNEISVDANESGEITYTYSTHGLFNAILGATDDQGNEENLSIIIRIEKSITWSQQATSNPPVMSVDARPDCDCDSPSKIEIDSTVENPPNLGGVLGSAVSVTWYFNGSEVSRQSNQELIADGQDASWTHNEVGPKPEIWNLDVSLSDNNENVNVEHIVTISYRLDESPANPFPSEN